MGAGVGIGTGGKEVAVSGHYRGVEVEPGVKGAAGSGGTGGLAGTLGAADEERIRNISYC